MADEVVLPSDMTQDRPEQTGQTLPSDSLAKEDQQGSEKFRTFDAADAAKSFGTGLATGAIGLAGLPGDLSEYGARGLDWATRKIGDRLGLQIEERPNREPFGGSAQIQKGIEKVTGDFYKPQTVYGDYAKTIGEFVPAVVGGPGSLWRRLAMQVAVPAVASETAGQITKGGAAEPVARAAAAFATPWALSRAVTPLATEPGRAAMDAALRAEGVTAQTAGQRTGSKALQYFESTLGDYPLAGQKTTKAQGESARQFTEAVLRRAGAPEGTPPTRAALGDAVSNLEKTFTDLSARSTLKFDQQAATDIADVLKRYQNKLPSFQKEIIHDVVNDLTTYGGMMPGAVYQPLRSDLSRMAQSFKDRDPLFADALRGIRNSLDGAMGRSIAPADRKAWEDARKQWAAWKVIQKAAKNTDDAGNIIITPSALKAAAGSKDASRFVRGEGDFANLAQAGQPILKSLPQSGTTPRAVAAAIPTIVGGALGLGASQDVQGGAGGAAAGAILGPALAGRSLMSAPVQRYLGNAIFGSGRDSLQAALLRAYIASKREP